MSDNPYKFYDVSSPEALKRAARRGGYWFYWIAAASLVNTALYYGGAPISFAIGLGVTQLIDGIVGAIAPQFYYLSAAVDVVIAAGFIGLGYLSGRGDITSFVVGLILYALDALLYIGLMILGRAPMTIIAIIWHGVAVYFLWKGFQAARELKNLPPEVPGSSSQSP
jgi:hypothetical protein